MDKYFVADKLWLGSVAIDPTTTSTVASATTTTPTTMGSTPSTEIVLVTGEVTPATASALGMDQGDLLSLITQACLDGASEPVDDGDWTAPQVILATTAAMVGIRVVDRALVALYRKLSHYETKLDHEEAGKRAFYIS